MQQAAPEHSELGKKTVYDPHYNPVLLFPIARQLNREKIGISQPLPFQGVDIWNHYEMSWLNEKGKPVIAIAEIIFPCDSEFLIESKSMKLYFNSFNNTKIKDTDNLMATIKKDIETHIHAEISIALLFPGDFSGTKIIPQLDGILLDKLDIDCDAYQHSPDFLHTESNVVSEVLSSNLLKANCLVTHQPDWASIQISYTGKKIHHADLLRYLVSFRNCNEFAETSVEHIFLDILQRCQPTALSVYVRYTRRGGIDINALRSTHEVNIKDINMRLCRQ